MPQNPKKPKAYKQKSELVPQRTNSDLNPIFLIFDEFDINVAYAHKQPEDSVSSTHHSAFDDSLQCNGM